MDEEVWANEIATGTLKNISRKAGVSFVNGVTHRTKDGQAVIPDHRFGLWDLPLDGGKAQNITAGMGDCEQMVFRCVDLEAGEEGSPPPFPPPPRRPGTPPPGSFW
jgi:hypothetical protein